MTEPENFLKRWSQRKLAERERSKDEHATNQHVPAEHDALAEPPQTDGMVKANEETFDLADLPAIDSIVANTDVTAFLRPGVPADLTRAALRRAWTSDPAIRDFVGLVENGWDFNDPSAMAGFGTITADEVAKSGIEDYWRAYDDEFRSPASQNYRRRHGGAVRKSSSRSCRAQNRGCD